MLLTTPYCMYVRKVRTKDTQHNQVGLELVPVHSLLLLLCSDKSCDQQESVVFVARFSFLSGCPFVAGWKYNFKECDKNIMWLMLLLYLILIISLCVVGQVVQVWLLLVHNNKGYWMLATCWMYISFFNVTKWKKKNSKFNMMQLQTNKGTTRIY